VWLEVLVGLPTHDWVDLSVLLLELGLDVLVVSLLAEFLLLQMLF